VSAVVLAISPQDVDSHERWAEQEGFEFPLLADVDMSVIRRYGLDAPFVGVRRSIFLVDTGGIVRYRYTGTVRAIFKKPRELARILEGID
jgi:peroxiredoxin Q/BCP